MGEPTVKHFTVWACFLRQYSNELAPHSAFQRLENTCFFDPRTKPDHIRKLTLLLKVGVCVCVCVNFSCHPRSRFSGNVYTCFSVWTVEELIYELWSPSHGCALLTNMNDRVNVSTSSTNSYTTNPNGRYNGYIIRILESWSPTQQTCTHD